MTAILGISLEDRSQYAAKFQEIRGYAIIFVNKSGKIRKNLETLNAVALAKCVSSLRNIGSHS